MRIIIVGDGKVGSTLAEKLSHEGHDIVLIDHSSSLLSRAANDLDVMTLQGNGAVAEVQMEAGVKGADLLIPVTSSDETNMLCCLLAHKLGAKHTITRVRNPQYAEQLSNMKEDFGLLYYISPEKQIANEIYRILSYTPAQHVETFAKNRVDLIELSVEKGSILDGVYLKNLYKTIHVQVLICAVQSGKDVYIPDGEYQLKAGDRISFIGSNMPNVDTFFHAIGFPRTHIQNVMIVGGGLTTMFLADRLIRSGLHVKIFETDKDRCAYLSENLPEAIVLNEDGTSLELLDEEGLANQDAFISLTGIDEENIVMGMYAHTRNVKKIVTKVERITNQQLLEQADIGSVVSSKNIAVNQILRYVRSVENAKSNDAVSTERIVNDCVDVLEFRVGPDSELLGVPIAKMNLKKNLLIVAICRGGRTIVPGPTDSFAFGDTVLLVTTNKSITKIQDITA